MEHYVKECVYIKEWFKELDRNDKDRIRRIWNEELEGVKGIRTKEIMERKGGEEGEKRKNRKLGIVCKGIVCKASG